MERAATLDDGSLPPTWSVAFALLQVDRKKQDDQKRAAAASQPVVGPDEVVSRGGAAGNVRAFARRQGMDADVRDGDNIMAWGILEGDPEKVRGMFLFLSLFGG